MMSASITPFLFLLITLILGIGVHGVPYKNYDIRRCDAVVLLDCPTTATGSAGRVTFYPYISINTSRAKTDTRYNYYESDYGGNCEQTGPCKLKVQTVKECGDPLGSNYAIYFNVRNFEIPRSSRLEIYDASGQGEPVMKRGWNGGDGWQHYNPTSVAQVRSDYARQPAFSVEYYHGRAQCRSARKVVFDYVITEALSTVNNTYCTALDGYVNSQYICDTAEDRVNCPAWISDSMSSLEPAYQRQYCLPSYWIIGGIAAASVVGLVILIVLLGLCRRRCRTCACVCRPRKICNWNSQRNCNFWSPYCSCAIKYDIQCDTGSDERLLAKKNDLLED
ncbi:uncharacterized protein LOC129595500 [Paramacrobiotus metropolitanus]|uniref:uncharacterized protein LOC129595500 n=1 Tax=Paramacrobiotus metropolitanus TaxID=2943436 RepID=UPI0024460A45|nr:uncharacterized protein LOC129595500 [Paramacrobiotus metropolitanus]XP_055348502.1 uncharacterized protein LOC129595500 [Paramacrobiotus metropolitanus]XP_055348503.1 uncharacterized protein LOC129595500 [Paramacrobiotus metropolitanus]XP_055348504.1 uncharacterized protein LOC129595500 [Paramacrobiotus metropolitanus]